jgi:hypothetical protein
MTTTSFLSKDASTLEDLFFMHQDMILIDKLRELQEMQLSKENLAKVSGIKNDLVLKKLVDMGICPDILSALAAIPLIEIAWADGKVDEKERATVLAAIAKIGIGPDSTEYKLLHQWLNHQPDAKLLSAWVHYIEGVCHEMTPDEKLQFKEEILKHARLVAEASGGIFGLGRKISKKEQTILDQLTAAFC